MKQFSDYLVEAAEGPRIPHPEDSIFDSSASASNYLQAMQGIAANPTNVTIKWDGMIALYFGRDAQGRFFIADKYMPAKGVFPTNPKQWQDYDASRGAVRADLYAKINAIWPGLERAVGQTVGTFKGDLMFVGPLQPVNNEFVFKPVTVEYHVPVNSDLGKLIRGRRALIVVHQFEGSPWNGRGLASNQEVAIIPPNAGIRFSIKNPVNLSNAASAALAKYGATIDKFLAGLPNVAREAIKKYVSHVKIGKTTLPIGEWLRANVSNKQYNFLVGDDQNGYLIQYKNDLAALFRTWNAISAFKESLAQQLEQQVKGFQQFVNGQNQGEGFVIPTKFGLVKLVQRAGFSAAHFAGFNAQKTQ
jgi:hypothetical protein